MACGMVIRKAMVSQLPSNESVPPISEVNNRHDLFLEKQMGSEPQQVPAWS